MGSKSVRIGKAGEREVKNALNDVVIRVRAEYGLPALPEKRLPFQRNQNQSAVGGHDLSNPFSLSIEVKRQEVLSLGAWWRQCLDQASPGETPVLIYRQSRKPWRVRMMGRVGPIETQVEISFEAFLDFFASVCAP